MARPAAPPGVPFRMSAQRRPTWAYVNIDRYLGSVPRGRSDRSGVRGVGGTQVRDAEHTPAPGTWRYPGRVSLRWVSLRWALRLPHRAYFTSAYFTSRPENSTPEVHWVAPGPGWVQLTETTTGWSLSKLHGTWKCWSESR